MKKKRKEATLHAGDQTSDLHITSQAQNKLNYAGCSFMTKGSKGPCLQTFSLPPLFCDDHLTRVLVELRPEIPVT